MVLTGRPSPGAERRREECLWSPYPVEEEDLAFRAATSLCLRLFSFCFKYKVLSGDSDYKPPACFHNSVFIASLFHCVRTHVCMCVTHYPQGLTGGAF